MWIFAGCLLDSPRLVSDVWNRGGHVLFLADYLPPHMIETGSPLFTSSLKWSFIVRLPFMALDSQIALLLARGSCAHCVPHTYCKTQWIPIINAFHHSACLFVWLRVRNVLLLSFSFHSRVVFSFFSPLSYFACHFLHSSAELSQVCNSASHSFVPLKRLKSM